MSWKTKIILLLILLLAGAISIFLFAPRMASIILSSKKSCRVLRIDQFNKAFMVAAGAQTNKFSIICTDGTICRADDTGFAAVKPGDLIIYRGYPEFHTVEEFGKCDHAQLLQFEPSATPLPIPSPTVTPRAFSH